MSQWHLSPLSLLLSLSLDHAKTISRLTSLEALHPWRTTRRRLSCDRSRRCKQSNKAVSPIIAVTASVIIIYSYKTSQAHPPHSTPHSLLLSYSLSLLSLSLSVRYLFSFNGLDLLLFLSFVHLIFVLSDLEHFNGFNRPANRIGNAASLLLFFFFFVLIN